MVKSTVNAESENAEFCLEFDKALAPVSPIKLASDLQLETEGKSIAPANIVAKDTSLCLFPLERRATYHLIAAGLRGRGDEKMSAPYQISFTIPDRSPTLAFTGKNGGVNPFASYDTPLNLHSVNVTKIKLDVYRITDRVSEANIWQNRAQTALAPTESAYLAREKGQNIWHEDLVFDASPNATLERPITLSDEIPRPSPWPLSHHRGCR